MTRQCILYNATRTQNLLFLPSNCFNSRALIGWPHTISILVVSGMVTNFCRKLSWGALEVVVSQLGQRIQFGAHRDLLDLLRLECMTGAMARGLHKSGVTTVAELAKSALKEVAAAIRKSLPYARLLLFHSKSYKYVCNRMFY